MSAPTHLPAWLAAARAASPAGEPAPPPRTVLPFLTTPRLAEDEAAAAAIRSLLAGVPPPEWAAAEAVAAGQPDAGHSCTGQPCTGQPGAGQPCTGQPCTGQPCTGQPCTGQPCTGQPCTGQPCTGQPCTGQPCTGQARYGLPPGALCASDWAAAHYGRWASTVQSLAEALACSGAAGVARGLVALEAQHEGLSELMDENHRGRTACKLRDLARANFPPTRFVVPGLVPVGLTSLAGRPKLGKSLLALQMALAVDSGGELFGQKTPKAKVLYIALEDTDHRLSERIKKMTATLGVDLDVHGDCDFVTDWEPLSGQGLQHLRRAFEYGYKLVVIDTFSRIAGRADQMDTQEMTNIYAALQRMANSHDAALLIVDHHRKSARTSLDTDPIDDILGSTAKGGVVDCALGLYRRHNEDEAVLKLSGRDFSADEMAVRWDAAQFLWTLTPKGGQGGGPDGGSGGWPAGRWGEAGRPADGGGQAGSDRHYTQREQETIDAVAELGEPTLTDLVAHLGGDRSNLYRRLRNLCQRGELRCRRCERGFIYVLHPAPGQVCKPASPGAAAGPGAAASPGP